MRIVINNKEKPLKSQLKAIPIIISRKNKEILENFF